jgi:fibronectin-binding autotransporter adhesin
MTSFTWKGVNGDWKTASDWTPSGGPPKSTDSATINGSATTTVTVDTADVAQSLTLSDANATLNDDSGASLTIGGTLAMSNGTLNDTGTLTFGALTLSGGALTIDGQLNLSGALDQTGGTLTLNGTIAGGTIDSTAGTLNIDTCTLSGVTFVGPLNLTSPTVAQSVYLADGATVVGSSGSGPGTINVSNANSLYFDNSQTVSNETINLGDSGDNYLYGYDTSGAGNQVLTLASSVTVNALGGSAYITSASSSGDGIVNQGAINQSGTSSRLTFSGNALTNSGTITGASSDGTLTIDDTRFTNSGTIDISDGETATIEPTNFTNAASGVISVGADSTLYLTPGGSWSNLGSITLASGSSLVLGGSFTLAGLGTLTNSGGTVYIQGTFNNTGGTLNGSNGLGQAVLDGGTVQGGTATSAGLAFSSGTLSGVTFDGPLNLTSPTVAQSVYLADGATVVGSSGSGPARSTSRMPTHFISTTARPSATKRSTSAIRAITTCTGTTRPARAIRS